MQSLDSRYHKVRNRNWQADGTGYGKNSFVGHRICLPRIDPSGLGDQRASVSWGRSTAFFSFFRGFGIWKLRRKHQPISSPRYPIGPKQSIAGRYRGKLRVGEPVQPRRRDAMEHRVFPDFQSRRVVFRDDELWSIPWRVVVFFRFWPATGGGISGVSRRRGLWYFHHQSEDVDRATLLLFGSKILFVRGHASISLHRQRRDR